MSGEANAAAAAANSSEGASNKASSSSSSEEVAAAAAAAAAAAPTPAAAAAETKGWLYKWTNYIKGYQKRWFVLANGLLSYYRYQAEMSHTCR